MNKPPKPTKLSIIILNHNTSELLNQCLSSIPQDPNYQIIVVDNASSDDSVAMVHKTFPQVEIIQSSQNLGYTKGNNLARKVAKGHYVLFLNSDTRMFAETLPEMLHLMDSDEKIGISTCLTLLPNGKLYYACHRGFPSPWNSFCYFTGLAKAFPKSKVFAGYTATYLPLTTTHEIDACSGTFLLIRKAVLDKVGWFDEDYFAYGDDLQLCFDVKKLGYKIVFDPEAKLIHYWGASSGLTKGASSALPARDKDNSAKWSQARYQAMKKFYTKNYQAHYPKFFNLVVYAAIDFISKVRRYSD